ncbi:zinc finger MYM-type protein 1-like [Bombina bombina]|uniref:zinc finger MYM-type protein 1-like n=1 Tax=Bombina bombina TaxID=8345 RepID=UPI00235B079D|nr:zinc finger MYM-type protein 1-like [Bombina bombina]
MENTISNLQNFSRLDYPSKVALINNGRPMPELKGLVQKEKTMIRTFRIEWYQRKEWLCGCATKNRLYCFSCILFSNNENVWTSTGFADLKNLSRAINKHEKSTSHIQNQISLKTFGSGTRIDLSLNEQRKRNISNHNAKVKENREILKQLIKATCYLGKQEIAFRGNEEGATSYNRGNYVELLHSYADDNARLDTHLKTSTVFSGCSNRIQNDLIEAVADVIREDIKTEIDAAPFVAVQVDETTDITNITQISVILRYVCTREETCEVKEAFLGFDQIVDRRAPAIANYVLGVLEKYNCLEKLVAQTYDGASVMASDLNGVQAKIKEKIPEATFIHCYAHKLNLVLSHSAKSIPECKVFFSTLEGMATFFSKSTKRTQVLDDFVKRRLPRSAPTRWSSHSRLVHTVNMFQIDLCAMFQFIRQNPADWDNEAYIMAKGYNSFLYKSSTCFLLMAYEAIFLQTDILFRLLQNKLMDVGFCCRRIDDTMKFLESKRQEFDTFYGEFEEKCVRLGLTDNERTRSREPIKDVRRRLFYNIIDNVTVQMRVRFDKFSELEFLSLVDCTKLLEMSKNIDDEKLQSLRKYAKYFDLVRLKCDLVGLYGSEVLRTECKSPGDLMKFLAKNDLMQTVPEAVKLLHLVHTIPATTASVERSFSALKRIKTHTRNRTDQGRLSSLAILAIERRRLVEFHDKDNEGFMNKVIENFVKKDRRMDFVYK